MNFSLRILFLASEADPFVKIGGLGDVALSLPRALKALDPGIDIRLVIPFHGAIQLQAYNLHTAAVFSVPTVDGEIRAEAFAAEVDGLPVYLIAGPPIPEDAPVYSGDNASDGLKYTFFSLAALELAHTLDWQPDIVHANDWHTSPAIYALRLARDQYPHKGSSPHPSSTGSPRPARDGSDWRPRRGHQQWGAFFQNTALLLGLHNLPYLGDGTADALAAFGLPPASGSALPTWAQALPLPLGLLAADHIVTVSPHYAQEILTPEFGAGLEDFLASRAGSISGILNGIDTARWDPAADPHLAANFDRDNTHLRRTNKTSLQGEFNLPVDPAVPLIGVVSRLDYQKGIDLLPDALRTIRDHNWHLIVLGTGDPALERALNQLETQFPRRARAAIRFDSALSSRIFAGADLTLIPSRYEPCGLTQMIAMRYGCVPLARATGGLVDTIQDRLGDHTNTGFLFKDAASPSLARTLERALEVYADQDSWRELQHNGMRQDFSWHTSARQYLQRYRILTEIRK